MGNVIRNLHLQELAMHFTRHSWVEFIPPTHLVERCIIISVVHLILDWNNVQSEGRRQGDRLHGRIQAVHHHQVTEPVVHARDLRANSHHRLHRHHEGPRGPAPQPCHRHREIRKYSHP